MFADTGGEKPETIAYVENFSTWLEQRGYPGIDIVRFEPVRAPYSTLEGNCLANETLPSLSFGRRSCSIKFKHEPLDRFVRGVSRGPRRRDPIPEWQEAQRRGVLPVRVIGYDAGEVAKGRGRDRRTGKLVERCKHFRYSYPLVEWGWDRKRCIRRILDAGLPAPLKSACFFCPASKPYELLWLAAEHPGLFVRALKIEDSAVHGRHGVRKVGGLGGYGGPLVLRNWRHWAEAHGIVSPGSYTIEIPPSRLLDMANEARPQHIADDHPICFAA